MSFWKKKWSLSLILNPTYVEFLFESLLPMVDSHNQPPLHTKRTQLTTTRNIKHDHHGPPTPPPSSSSNFEGDSDRHMSHYWYWLSQHGNVIFLVQLTISLFYWLFSTGSSVACLLTKGEFFKGNSSTFLWPLHHNNTLTPAIWQYFFCPWRFSLHLVLAWCWPGERVAMVTMFLGR